MSLSKRALRDGIVAGLLAGALLAVLFWFYDLGRGEPFRTPAYLFGAITGQGDGIEPGPGVVAAYTLMHFAAWAALGIFAALLIDWADMPRNILIGAAYGLFACSLLFYGGLVLTGTDVFRGPSWVAVFFGNALAGMVMFAYLHWRSSEPGITGVVDFLRTHDKTRQGLCAGLIGAVVVALWFLLIDTLLRGEPLYTPAVLGTILFRGGGPEQVAVTAGPVIGYTFVHFAAFILFGGLLTGLIEQIENYPPLIFGLLILAVVFELFIVAMMAVLGAWVLEELAWWAVLGGNLLAAVAMGLYLWRAHPTLREQLTDDHLWTE